MSNEYIKSEFNTVATIVIGALVNLTLVYVFFVFQEHWMHDQKELNKITKESTVKEQIAILSIHKDNLSEARARFIFK